MNVYTKFNVTLIINEMQVFWRCYMHLISNVNVADISPTSHTS
jgi:hypothetical protein